MATIKLLHILFLFVWVGALFSLTYLLARVQNEMLNVMRRFYLCVDLPAMVVAISLGLLLFVLKGVDIKQGWLHMKLMFTFFLVVTDVVTGRLLCSDKSLNERGLKFKVLNALVILFLAGILVSVFILK